MPRKAHDLFDAIAAFPALHAAALRAAAGKRAKPGVAAFLANLEKEVLRLERDLASGRYRPGRYKTIEIFDPKHRIVSAAPFRDRVVHHAFCAVCEPLFERGFIHDSYANRTGKGTHRAVARYERFRDRFRHVLRCDIYRYFPAIDHAILKHDLRRRIACPRTLALADRIVDGANPQEPVPLYYPGDDRFTPFGRRRSCRRGTATDRREAGARDGSHRCALQVIAAFLVHEYDSDTCRCGSAAVAEAPEAVVMSTLTKEIAAYERMRKDLESEHHGSWVVVHDEQLVGTYPSFELAADDAVSQFGRGPYLIREVGGRAPSLPASVLYRPLHA